MTHIYRDERFDITLLDYRLAVVSDKMLQTEVRITVEEMSKKEWREYVLDGDGLKLINDHRLVLKDFYEFIDFWNEDLANAILLHYRFVYTEEIVVTTQEVSNERLCA